jgi:hypothetical protein
MPLTIAGVLAHTIEPSRLLTRIGGVLDGLLSCVRFERAPVPGAAYRLWRRMRKSATPLRLSDVVPELAPRG